MCVWCVWKETLGLRVVRHRRRVESVCVSKARQTWATLQKRAGNRARISQIRRRNIEFGRIGRSRPNSVDMAPRLAECLAKSRRALAKLGRCCPDAIDDRPRLVDVGPLLAAFGRSLTPRPEELGPMLGKIGLHSPEFAPELCRNGYCPMWRTRTSLASGLSPGYRYIWGANSGEALLANSGKVRIEGRPGGGGGGRKNGPEVYRGVAQNSTRIGLARRGLGWKSTPTAPLHAQTRLRGMK